MKIKDLSSFLLCFSLSLMFACYAADDAAEQQIIGRWAMVKVSDGGEDVTSEHNPARDRRIEFRADGAFISDGQPFGRNSGRWEFDPMSKVLYLDSDAGEDDDSYWIVRFKDKHMNWQGTRSEFAKRFRMEFKHLETR